MTASKVNVKLKQEFSKVKSWVPVHDSAKNVMDMEGAVVSEHIPKLPQDNLRPTGHSKTRTAVPTSVHSPDYSPPDEQPPTPNQMTIGPDRGVLVQGSQSLVRVKLPGCFTPSRVFFLEYPEFNREWMNESISEPE